MSGTFGNNTPYYYYHHDYYIESKDIFEAASILRVSIDYKHERLILGHRQSARQDCNVLLGSSHQPFLTTSELILPFHIPFPPCWLPSVQQRFSSFPIC